MIKPKKRYTLQGIGHTLDTVGRSVDTLTEMVGAMAVEQTVMKDDIAQLKQRTTRLDLKTDGIINDARAFRAEMMEFREETRYNFENIQDDLTTILPDHEVRIAILEGQPVEALGV